MLGLSRALKTVCQWMRSAPMCPTGTWMPMPSAGKARLAMSFAPSAYAVAGKLVGDSRLLGARRFDVGGARAAVAAPCHCHTTPIERPRPLSVELERGVELGGRLRVVNLLQVDDAEIVVRV